MQTRADTTKARPVKGGTRALRLANKQLWLGFGVTLLVALLVSFGLTRRLEYPLYDLRLRLFNFFAPPPSPDVVVVAIDDGSLETVGKWPWPRERIGLAVKELERAGASVVALDLLLEDPQEPQLVGEEGDLASFRVVDNDAQFAAAIAERRRTVLAISFAMERTLALQAGWFQRVLDSVASNPAIGFDELRRQMLPDAPPLGPEVDRLQRQFERARVIIDTERIFAVPTPSGSSGWPFSNDPRPPLPVLARSAGGLAGVSFGGGDGDGGVRRIPLWVEVRTAVSTAGELRTRGRLYPSLGFAAGLMHLGVPLSTVRVSADETAMTLPDGGRIEVPMHRAVLREMPEQGRVRGLMHVRWPRGGWGGWRSQFAQPDEAGVLKPTEFAMGRLLDPVLVIQPSIRFNIATLDRNMIAAGELYGLLDVPVYSAVAAEMASLTPEEPRWHDLLAVQRRAWGAVAMEAAGLVEQFEGEGIDPESLSDEECAMLRDLRGVVSAVAELVEEIDAGLERIRRWRQEELPSLVRGKICFVGWTATGALADFVRTSIDSRTPGVHVHAAVANSLLVSRARPVFITKVPPWVDLAGVVVLGILGTIIGVRTGVLLSPLVLLAAVGGWFLLDGLIFWDWRGVQVDQAGPLIASVAGWLAVILYRLLVEQRSRRQTEARFRSYVSPDVVDILVNNPELDSMRPQKRELTIFFSDIASWTTLAERLGTEGIYRFLAAYLKEMTDILQDNRATIDKYLGDGIMAFWGAPIEDPDHAANAVKACVLMQQRLTELNDSGFFGDAGRITVRMGIASGEVNVGDFGNPPHKSSYTVIGDAANLAARLESANKQFGSLILMTERTRALAGITEGLRLMGRIIVKGKTEPETIYEPIGQRRPHGERTGEWIGLTNKAVQAYIDGRFDEALTHFDALEREFGDAEMAQKYRDAIREVREAGGPGEGFAGTIVLTDK